MLNAIQLSRIDLNLLVLFDTVFRERHVGRTATRLNVSPSAVSHGLTRLRRLMNDPLFLRHPKGVVPTARAGMLAAPIGEILARAESVIASAAPFEPSTSARRFVIGAPDGVSAVLLPPLLTEMRKAAPGIDLSVRNLVGKFETALADLDQRALDVALIPFEDTPARFVARELYDEDFVLVKRRNHRLSDTPTFAEYAAGTHVVVSATGDFHGFVDDVLVRHGLTRRVALTVPHFMLALAVVSASDLVAAMPRKFVTMHAGRYDVAIAEPPRTLGKAAIRAIVPRAAVADAGLSWLLDRIERAAGSERVPTRRRGAR